MAVEILLKKDRVRVFKKILPVFFILFFIIFLVDDNRASAQAGGKVEIYQILVGNGAEFKGPTYKEYPSYDAIMFDMTKTNTNARAVSFKVSSYADATFEQVLTTKQYVPSQYGWTHFTGMGFNCNAHYIGELRDKSGYIVLSVKMTVTGLERPRCDSEPDGDMGSDMGSNGDGDGDGNGDGDGDGGDLGSGTCDACGIFDCPGWDDYMGKLEDIKNAIPPAPNWHHVSDIFSDAIVPRLVEEMRIMLDDLLGRAPEPPPSPPNMPTMPDLPNLDDGGFKSKEPDMPDSGVKGFDKDDIKENAPELKYEEDDTGGFDLSIDPVDALPDVVPGGDPGPYKRDPVEMPAEYPGAPKGNDVDIGKPPNPNDGVGTPPNPNDGVGTPPNPNDGVGTPPNPDDQLNFPNKVYKPQPD